jgi:ABC-type nickel/cobalt efflux system permease component RcnA
MLLFKGMIISVILVIVAALYVVLPGGMFGMDNGRSVFFVTVSIMLLISLLWISWRTWAEARSTLPAKRHRLEQKQRLQDRMDDLTDVDVKQRLNVVNWSRMDGVLTEYLKKITRIRRHLIGLEYTAIKKHVKKSAIH